VTDDRFRSVGESFFSGYNEELRKLTEEWKHSAPKPKPKPKQKNKAGRRRASIPSNAPPQGPPVPTAPTPEMVMLEGMFEGKYLGHYSLSFAMGQLMVDVYQASPSIGGMYAVEGLPIGEWFVLGDKRGFLLPVAVQRVRMDAYVVRVDPAPLQGLRALPAAYGAAPPQFAGQRGRPVPPARWAAQPQRTPQQTRQNDQAAIRALQTGSQASYNAMMNTARHFHS
jgi:hypothetical protein